MEYVKEKEREKKKHNDDDEHLCDHSQTDAIKMPDSVKHTRSNLTASNRASHVCCAEMQMK